MIKPNGTEFVALKIKNNDFISKIINSPHRNMGTGPKKRLCVWRKIWWKTEGYCSMDVKVVVNIMSYHMSI